MTNIYLMKSVSYNLLNDRISKITDGIENIETYSLLDTELDDILESASYYGMFSETKAIIVKDTKYFGGQYKYEDETEKLTRFFNNMQEDTIIIFICDELNKSKSLTKEALKHNAEVIEITKLEESQLFEYLKIYNTNNNITISDKALKTLIENSIDDYDICLQELNKLALYDNGNITDDLVSSTTPDLKTDYTFDFSNAVIAKNFNLAFDLLDKLLSNDVEAFSIVGLLASSFTNMYIVKKASSDGLDDYAIEKLTGFKSGRVYVLKKNSRIYTLDELKNDIHSIYELDKRIKTGYNPVYGIKEFLLSL